MTDYIYFYIPGLLENFEQNFMLATRMMEHPDHFYDNVRIGAIFGCPPSALWNGGRFSKGRIENVTMENYIEIMRGLRIPIRYTWTNPVLTDEDYEDEFCNWVTTISEDGFNEILVNNDKMEDYIKHNYPKYPLISSTTKRITKIDNLNEELKKDYKLVVLDYDFNNDWESLNKIEKKDKCEILINPLCNPKCPFRKLHYQVVGTNQKGDFSINKPEVQKCDAQERLFHEIKQLPTFITKEDLYNKYVPSGFRHFKIEGRCASPLKSLEWYLYYMVKPEYIDEERGWLNMALETTLLKPNMPIFPNIEK